MPKATKRERVQGIGGLFFRSADPEALSQWYQRHVLNGRFARLQDPDGNPIELWEPAGRDKRR